MKKKDLVFIIIFLFTGLFFYSFNLKQTYLFAGDTARDAFKALKIWQDKELTLIGPPISFTEHTTREAYLGSLYLYVAILGLMISNWDVLGITLPNIFFFTLSIPLFYILSCKFLNSFQQRVFATIIYSLSPLTITHARFFWNPNLIIPFSVLFWYLILNISKNTKHQVLFYGSAGVVAGIMFNLHYLVIIPIIVYLLTLFVTKHFLKSLTVIVGLFIGTLPTIIFEIKNNFYLTNAMLFNMSRSEGSLSLNLIDWLYYFLNIFWTIFGLRKSEIDFPTVFTTNINIWALFTVIIIVLSLVKSKFKEVNEYSLYYPMLVVAFLVTIYFSAAQPLRVRYLFSIYPVLIYIITVVLWRLNLKYWTFLFLVPVILSAFLILNEKPKFEMGFLKLESIENICKAIVNDNPTGRYNITESLRGDARAVSYRFCLQRDAKVKPQDILSYSNLDTLYVVSTSLEKAVEEKRWEFVEPTSYMKLKSTQNVSGVKIFKFEK